MHNRLKHYSNGNNPWQICQKVLYVANVRFWLNETGTMCPLKKTATLTNEKLLDLPEIVQPVVYQKYPIKSCCLSRWINCKQWQLCIICLFFQSTLNVGSFRSLVLQSTIWTSVCNFKNKSSQSIDWLPLIKFLCFNEADKIMEENLSPFSFCNNQMVKNQAMSINWSTSFVKIIAGSLDKDPEGNLNPLLLLQQSNGQWSSNVDQLINFFHYKYSLLLATKIQKGTWVLLSFCNNQMVKDWAMSINWSTLFVQIV